MSGANGGRPPDDSADRELSADLMDELLGDLTDRTYATAHQLSVDDMDEFLSGLVDDDPPPNKVEQIVETAPADDSAPRLPPATHVVPTVEMPTWAVDAARTRPTPGSRRSVSPLGARTQLATEPFIQPVLYSMKLSNGLLLFVRVLLLAWAAAVAIAAVVARENAIDGFDSGEGVRAVGLIGIGVVALASLTGWLWCDRRVRNVHLLDGRRPGRLRCATAWLLPGLWCALLAVVVVPIEPAELFDVRPTIIVSVFAIALWRPYSLERRILTSLSRMKSDALIGAAYVLDLAAFGFLWWQLTDWPLLITASNSGRADVMVGLALASTIAFAANAIVWAMLVRSTNASEAHRAVALRTRHEHRQLRLRGIDPSDPQVWWALVRKRAANHGELPSLHDPSMPRPAWVDSVSNDMVARARERNRGAFVRLGTNSADDVVERLREQFASVLPAPTAANARAGLGKVAVDPVSPEESTTGDATDPLRRLRRMFTGEPALPKADGGHLQRLVDQASLVEVEAALAERYDTHVRLVPPRLAWAEVARSLALVSFVAVVALALWLIGETFDAGTARGVASGPMSAEVVGDIDLARRMMLTAFSVAVAMIPLWVLTVSVYARKAGVQHAHVWRTAVILVVVWLVAAGTYVYDGDERGLVSGLCVAAACGLSAWSAIGLGAIQRWFGLSATTIRVVISVVFLMMTTSLLGGLYETIGVDDALQVLAFFATLQAIGAGVVGVTMALNAAEAEDAIRLAPELAVPVNSL